MVFKRKFSYTIFQMKDFVLQLLRSDTVFGRRINDMKDKRYYFM